MDVLSGGGVDDLANGESNHGSLSGTGLGLGYDVTTLDDGPHRPLLDSGGLLEAVVVNTTEEIVFDPHLIEAHDGLYPVRCDELQFVLVDHAAAPSGSVQGHHARRRGCCHG